MSQDEKLLNCPFCGAFPENVFGTIMCNYCGVKIEGVDKWNRRPSSGSPLPVELDENKVKEFLNEAIKPIFDRGIAVGMRADEGHVEGDLTEERDNLAQAICSRFSQKKVTNLEGETK